MASYELYVEIASYEGGTDGENIPIEAKTDQEAIEKSRRLLIGDLEQWKGCFKERHGKIQFEFKLDPEEVIARETGYIVFMEANRRQLFNACLRRTQTVQVFDLDELRKDIEQAGSYEKRRCEADPEYKKYLKLKNKFEG